MILNKENEILDDPAYKDFINNFIDRNKNKVIYLLRYTKEESELINNLKQVTKEKVDIILSEILPNELPNCILLEEYKFFVSKYVFLAAKHEKINKISKSNIAILKDTDLFTKESKSIDIISEIIETSLNCEVINYTENVNISELIIKCSEFDKIIINLTNPYILYRIVNYCRYNNKLFSLGSASVKNLTRFIILGFNIKTKAIFPKFGNLSLREETKFITNFKFFDDLFCYNKDDNVVFFDIKYTHDYWSIPHACDSNEDSSSYIQLPRFEMLTLHFLLCSLRLKNVNNQEYIYLLISKNIFKIKDFYTRIRFLRDVAKIENLDHKKFFVILKIEFDKENSSAFKFEFLISCLFASKNPKITEKSLLSINSLLSSANFGANKVNSNEIKFSILNEIISLISENKINEINELLIKNRKSIENFGFLLTCLPSILSNDQLNILISNHDFIFEPKYFHYFFRGLLYAYDLDSYEIQRFCINNTLEKSLYANLHNILLKEKVLNAILPVSSNILCIFLKDISFKKDLTKTAPPAKFGVARLYMLSNDNESAIEVLSTTDFSEIDDVDSIALLSFFRIWNKIGITQENINIPKNIEEIPHEKRYLLWDLYSYMKDTDYDFGFDIKRINEEKNEFSWHLC